MASRSRDETRVLGIRGNFRAVFQEDAGLLRVEQRKVGRATCAEPEVLNGVGIRRAFTGKVRLVKAEEAAFAIVEGDLASRICASRNHGAASILRLKLIQPKPTEV